MLNLKNYSAIANFDMPSLSRREQQIFSQLSFHEELFSELKQIGT